MAGDGVTDATRAKWAEMDDGTALSGAQMRMDASQPGMFGQGRASRALQGVNQSIMQQNAANKLKQAQMAGSDMDSAIARASSWLNQQDSSDRADRQAAMAAAEAMGDTTTMAGLNQQNLGRMGYDYTSYGQGQLADQAAQAKSDAEWARQLQERQLAISEAQSQNAINLANKKPSKWKSALKGAGAGAATGGAIGNVPGAIIGGGLGALSSIF